MYLDRLWRTVQANHPPDETAPVVFDQALVHRVGKIDDVLTLFVDDQIKEIGGQFSEADKPAIKRILETFVTYEGTRREGTLSTLATETGFNVVLIRQIADALETSRILQCDEGSYELAHDSLAKVIDKGRSTEQRQINDILERLKEAWQEYIETKKPNDLLLPQRRLAEIQLYETAIHTELSRTNAEAIWQFVIDSGAFLEKERQAELDEQRKKTNRLRLTIAGVSVLLVMAIIAMIFAFWQQIVAQDAADKAQSALNLVTLQRASAAQATGLRYRDYDEPELARNAFIKADSLLRGLPDNPIFPDNNTGSVETLQRLKDQLSHYHPPMTN